MRRTRSLLFVALPAAFLVAAAGVAFWSAERTLTRSAGIARTQQRMSYTLRTLDISRVLAENPGFEPVLARGSYTSGAVLDGNSYLAGPFGLSVYTAAGALRQTMRTGFALPVAPIVAVATGRLRGTNEAQVLMATAGEGLLLLQPAEHGRLLLRQLLPDSVEARDVTALLPLVSGDLLLGTRHAGVLLFDGSTLTPYAATALGAKEITSLAAADSTSVLIGTRNQGVFYAHAGTVQHAGRADGMPDDQVEALAEGDGKAYVGTPLGVAEFELGAADSTVFKPARVLAPGLFSHALAIAPGRAQLLVGSLDEGITEVEVGSRPRLRRSELVTYAGQTSTRIDAFVTSSAIYAIEDGSLLARTTNGWRPALPDGSSALADANIAALAFAPDGSLYVGFFDHGLDVVAPGNVGLIRHVEDDHLFCVNRLALDPVRQTIAAATADGLVLFDRQGAPRQVLTRRDGLISDHVTDVVFTKAGMTLATPAGLTFVTASGTESVYAFEGLVNNHVYALGASGDRVLAGTLGGLSVLDAGAVRRNLTVTNSGLKHNWITAVTQAPQGDWLIGTYGAGVEMLSANGEHFAPIELPAGAPRDLAINPNALLVTRTHVYAGTLGHGMLVENLASGRWSVVTHGLPSENVTAFAERGGELYVGTENGLVRIAEAKLP